MTLSAADTEVLADGVIAAMVAVSLATDSALGDAWEGESARMVAASFAGSDVNLDEELRGVLHSAVERWPSTLTMLRGVESQLGETEAMDQVKQAALVAKAALGDRLEDYRIALFNVMAATAAAAGEDGLRVGGDKVTEEEQRIISLVDALF